MSLKGEILPYIDAVGLVSPNLPVPVTGRASGNGVCYTSEYYILLNKNGELKDQDRTAFAAKIGSCIDSNGLLNRAQAGTDPDQEGPDDYLGVLSACKSLGNTEIPRQFLKAVFKYQGFLNNSNPGKWTLSSFLIRQPQLLACMVAAAFPSFNNPLHLFSRLLAAPLFFVSAVIIATNCMFTDPSDTDSRRLGWHVWQTLKPVSLTCWLAGKIWEKRLFRDFGAYGMLRVAAIYYQKNHPFATYWTTE